MTLNPNTPGVAEAPQAFCETEDISVRNRVIGVWTLMTLEATLEGKCTLPAWIGTEQKRQCEFVGSQLVLRFGPNKLVWEHLPD
ncbi:MAG: hypothetical protein JWP08_3317 [Bryobacterales bacterium]|nr:hypothetical protein [Bryobacterales bacterium]